MLSLRKDTTETARRHRVMPEVEIIRRMRRPALSNNHVVTPVARTWIAPSEQVAKSLFVTPAALKMLLA
jgi:hypothetical protein